MSLGRTVAMVGTAFCLTLAIIVVRELSSEALAVAIGVVCGVAAGIPASILLYVTLAGRGPRGRRGQDDTHPGQQGQVPPLIIVQGQPPPPLAQDSWFAPPEDVRPLSQVRLVGGEDLVPGEGQDNRG